MNLRKPETTDGIRPTRPALTDGDTDLASETATIVGGESVVDNRSSPTQVKPGQKLGKYEINALLGAGGMGTVYLAFDPLIEREVAIKVLPDVNPDSPAVHRFLQEARAIGRMNHPHVVSIYDINLWQGQYYLVMELLAGGSLAQYCAEHGPLPWRKACEIVAQAARGLAAAHTHGLIHRDIKPENLMLTQEGVVKVVDFGLSKLIDADSASRTTLTQAGQILGTPHYMSPEQFEGGNVDARSDIYSLGGTLVRLLTGGFPFQEAATVIQVMTAHLTKPPPAIAASCPDAPAELDRIIARAMAKRPDDRYSSAAELLQELVDLLRQTAPQPSPACDRTDGPPLLSAVVVEPSRLLAGAMKDAAARAGARRIDVVQTKQDALLAVHASPPDLLFTAMQLADGRATEFLAALERQSLLKRTCVVLSSSDSTLDDLTTVASAPARILAPKSARHDDVLRVVHAAGPRDIAAGPLARPLDPSTARLFVVADLEEFPAGLTRLIQPLGLQNGAIADRNQISSIPPDGSPAVVLIVQTPDQCARDAADTVRQQPASQHLFATVRVEGEALLLRSLRFRGVIAETNATLDAHRLTCLLQACRAE